MNRWKVNSWNVVLFILPLVAYIVTKLLVNTSFIFMDFYDCKWAIKAFYICIYFSYGIPLLLAFSAKYIIQEEFKEENILSIYIRSTIDFIYVNNYTFVPLYVILAFIFFVGILLLNGYYHINWIFNRGLLW